MSRRGAIQRLGDALNRWSERYIPDPFVLAIILTFVAFVLGLIFYEATPDAGFFERAEGVLAGWSGKFFDKDLLNFAFQMCLILVTGHALALSSPVQRLVKRIALFPKTTAHAAVLVAIVALIAGVIHWGLGAVVGAFLAREIGMRAKETGRKIHYPILGAAAYMGLLVWHGGLSASAPLNIATDDHFLMDAIGQISTSQTIFSSFNVIITGVILVLVPVLFWALTPKDSEHFVPFSGDVSQPLSKDSEYSAWPKSGSTSSEGKTRVAGALENSQIIAFLIGGIGMFWIVFQFATGATGINLNSVNFTFLFAGILFHRRPISYVRAVTEGAKGCAGIILQFPFYFGILGIFAASGLIEAFAGGLADFATERTLPVLTFVSAGVVNLFVPSGGGQWAIQGEILVESVHRVGGDLEHTIMAFCYGDQLTNMLQPFWALPLLAITGLKARQIIGYTAAIMFLVTPVYLVLIFLLA